jgi:hypothetical protein
MPEMMRRQWEADEPEIAGRWLFATASRPMARVEIDARVEGSFRFVDRRIGAITEYTGEFIEMDSASAAFQHDQE